MYSGFWLLVNQQGYTGKLESTPLVQTALQAMFASGPNLDTISYLMRAFFSRLLDPWVWGLWGAPGLVFFASGLAVQ